MKHRIKALEREVWILRVMNTGTSDRVPLELFLPELPIRCYKVLKYAKTIGDFKAIDRDLMNKPFIGLNTYLRVKLAVDKFEKEVLTYDPF